jgi:glycosyltransferase involved in cell wall biosynthesis
VRPKSTIAAKFDIETKTFNVCNYQRLKEAIKKTFFYGYRQNKRPKEPSKSEFCLKRPYFPFQPLSEEVVSLIYNNSEWADLIQAEFHESLFVGYLPLRDIPKVFVCHQAHNIYTETYYSDMRAIEPTADNALKVIAEGDRMAALSLECAAMSSFDKVIVFSESDKQSLLPKCTAPISVSPFPFPTDVPLLLPEKSMFEASRLLFLGPGNWHPNVDAFNWFYYNVLVVLKNKLGISAPLLNVLGSWDDAQTLAYDPSLVCFHGYAEDLSIYLKGSISINPVFTGAGLRTKLLAAAASASPIVSTTHGADGTGLTHGKDCLLADNAEEFANAVVSLLRDKELAYQLSINAFNHVKSNFSHDAVRIRRNHIFQSLRSSRLS